MPDENLITRTPLATLASYMGYANKANGALLVASGFLGLIHAFTSPSIGFFASILTSIYVGGLGALLLRYEFAAGAELRADFGFMYTYLGRAAFLLLVGNLAWTCAPLGAVAAVATNANALLSAYVMYAHPSFTSGHASATAIGGLDGEAGNELMGGSLNSSSDAFDPASTAARARAASGGS